MIMPWSCLNPARTSKTFASSCYVCVKILAWSWKILDKILNNHGMILQEDSFCILSISLQENDKILARSWQDPAMIIHWQDLTTILQDLTWSCKILQDLDKIFNLGAVMQSSPKPKLGGGVPPPTPQDWRPCMERSLGSSSTACNFLFFQLRKLLTCMDVLQSWKSAGQILSRQKSEK